MTLWIKKLFRTQDSVIVEDPEGRSWVIWDQCDKRIVYTLQSNQWNPRDFFGGPWANDPERYRFIPMDILDTLDRLNLK